jgi:hypothetical protein
MTSQLLTLYVLFWPLIAPVQYFAFYYQSELSKAVLTNASVSFIIIQLFTALHHAKKPSPVLE